MPTKKIVQPDAQTRIETYQLPQTDFSIRIERSLSPIAELWDKLAPAHNIFLQRAYLEALQQYPPDKMGFRYLVFYKEHQPVGIAYVQTFHIRAEDSIQQQEQPETRTCILSAITRSVKNWFVRRTEFHLLICGNILLTGEHGCYFQPEVGQDNGCALVQNALEVVLKVLDKEDVKTSLLLFKDYENGHHAPLEAQLKGAGYRGFTIQPDMFLPVRENWKTFDDYLNDMSSKYRVRARRAFKKGQEIEKRELSLEEIAAHQPTIYKLYQQVAKGVGFNAFHLHPHYFYGLKEWLGDRYKLVAYFIGGELVAFYTGIHNGAELEAHFLGVDDTYNPTHQVYLNILYDLVRMGIYYQVTTVDFARTALEIKSSVGAVPRDMVCYVRHRNSLSNAFLMTLFQYLNPKEVWQPRHPFKDSPESEGEGE